MGNGFGIYVIDVFGIQNGVLDGVVLVDVSSNVIQFLSYEGSFIVMVGVLFGFISVDIGVSQFSSMLVGVLLQLIGIGV